MAHTNVTVRRESLIDDQRSAILLKTDLQFWQNTAALYRGLLENIPAAIREHGYVDFNLDGDSIRLIEDPSMKSAP